MFENAHHNFQDQSFFSIHKFQKLGPGQGRHVIIPNGHQIIQVAGADGQPAQIMIVPQGNVILIPQMNQNTPQKKQHQPQALQGDKLKRFFYLGVFV